MYKIFIYDGSFAENIALGVSKENIDNKIIEAAKVARIKDFIDLFLWVETLLRKRN